MWVGERGREDSHLYSDRLLPTLGEALVLRLKWEDEKFSGDGIKLTRSAAHSEAMP